MPKIAVITDLHYSSRPLERPKRKGHLAANLTQKAIQQINDEIKPDATVVLGDLVNDFADADATERLVELRGLLETLTMPWLVIPGNHDPRPEAFFEIFDRVEILDVAGLRLVGFVDLEQPQHCARRDDTGFALMKRAAEDFAGPRVALQHVPICEPHTDSQYGYTNHEQVHQAMRDNGYVLAISGHEHRGVALKSYQGVDALVVPALCEEPHLFAVVTIEDGSKSVDMFQVD